MSRHAGGVQRIKTWAKGNALVVAIPQPRRARQVTPRLAAVEQICGAGSVHSMRTRLSSRRAEFDACLQGSDPGELLTPGLA